ncbi:MAG: tetratricopeptide repeat protein [Planctomycetes bacterium]|nr:tetratricopeptide repeat protein [Planctomycetota bacterium]
MRLSRISLGLPLLLAGACGDAASPAVPSETSTSARAGAPNDGANPGAKSAPVRDERLLALADAFERGELTAADTGLLALPERGGLEGELLRARLASARGDDVAAVRVLEAAKLAHPRDARVQATAAELFVLAGRMQTAEDEIRAGLAIEPLSPDLRRARGVVLISKPGGAEAGLAHLLAARAADPNVPYLHRALAEAHRLAATKALSEQDPARALQHVSAALLEVSDQPDALLLGADAHMLLKHFDQALAVYERLLKDGLDVGAELAQSSKTAATAALLEKNRPLALERFLRARELGLGGEALGFGATMLADEAKAKLEVGWKAFDAGDLAGAESAFRDALRFDPSSLDARRALGAALYSREDVEGAAAQWRLVLETACARQLELSEPVYLDLARALHRLQRIDELRQLLEEELAARPDGPGAVEAREMLARLANSPTR